MLYIVNICKISEHASKKDAKKLSQKAPPSLFLKII